MIAIVEAAQKKALMPLDEKRKMLVKEAKNMNDELKDEINTIKKTISELNDISVLEDHILFLQVSKIKHPKDLNWFAKSSNQPKNISS